MKKTLIGKDIFTRQGILHMCLQFQPKDIWRGIYIESLNPFQCYLTLLPCFPIHILYIKEGHL